MKKYIQNLLAFLARKIITKYEPRIIGITGSVGKTSAKEAIFAVVSQKYFAWKSEKNFNSEFGLPYAIIGVKEDPGKSITAWLKLLFKGFQFAYVHNKYPQVLVLEMGVDHPGDMDYLFSIAKPSIGVITNISFAHYEFFNSPEEIAKEKGKLAEILPTDGYLILNADNSKVLEQKNRTKAQVITYSTKINADIYADSIAENFSEKPFSEISVQKPSSQQLFKYRGVGTAHASAILAAIAVAEVLKIEKDLVAKGTEQYKPQGGRMNLILGLKHAFILDDSYNASPEAVFEALKALSRMPQTKKVAVLGDMKELGNISQEKHAEVGKLCSSLGLSYLFTVGYLAKTIGEAAVSLGYDENSWKHFNSSEEAKKAVSEMLDENTAVLIKGSQSMRMEKITKEIMAEPARAEELLCRQYGHWLKD